jgi:8-oxo-dGTP diphosphatase
VSGGGGVQIVTAALIERDGRLLACKRPPGGRQPGLWEFPGGTVEPGEDPRAGLRRELREELGIDAEIGEPFEIVFHRYEFGDVLLLFFRASVTAGLPEPLHHAEIRWVLPSELSELEFLPADRRLIEKLA